MLFGSSETILPYARDYLGIILYSTVFFAFAFTANNIIRAEGNAKTAMLTMIISAGLNVIITPIFIFGFEMGIRGAALFLCSSLMNTGMSSISLLIQYHKKTVP